MQELITPVQFESALDTLNRINKLYLSDKVCFSIDAIQACKNPVGTGNPIIGKFPKCSVGGAVCEHLVEQGFTNYEYAFLQNSGATKCTPHTFAQKVYGALIMVTHRYAPEDAVRWESPNESVIKALPTYTWTWLPFVGFTLNICAYYLGARYRAGLYGFY